MAVEFSASLGLSDVDPVGGSIAGTTEAVLFDKCLTEYWAIAIAALPMAG